MSEEKFTQARWTTSSCGRAVYAEIGDEDFLIADLDHSDRPDDEVHANGNLIAAASDLYEACKALLDITLHKRSVDDGVKATELAMAAIAKAEGHE